MADIEKVIKGLKETEIMLIQAVDRGGEMAVMGAFRCLNRVTDALALLKEQEAVVRCKDCKHFNTTGCADGFGWCERNGNGHGSTMLWFCADGERR